MYRPYTRAQFDSARCTGCGECFHRCPVMRLSPAQAKDEIERLRAQAVAGLRPQGHVGPTEIPVRGLAAVPTAGSPDRRECRSAGGADGAPAQWTERSKVDRPSHPTAVLRRCTSCLACNQVCPEDCRPANLILDLWHEAYLLEGLPARAAWFLPHSRPNFRTYILDRLPQEERETVARWRHGGPAREFLYTGCNLITTPYITFSRLFEGMEIRGGLDYCCGEMLFRMGLYEAVEQVARRLTLWFRRLGAERVYLVCTAGLNLLRNILPQFGADFVGIEFLPFQQVILERLRGGDLRPTRLLNWTVTVQDSCHARSVAPGFVDLPRQLLETIGVQVHEAPSSQEDQLCCGIGGGFSHSSAFNPFNLLLSARRTSLDHRRVPADATCVYCSGCLEMMSVARFADPNRRPVLHLLELVQWAIGETPRRRQATLARQFLAGALRCQFPTLLSSDRFWLPEIEPEPNPAETL